MKDKRGTAKKCVLYGTAGIFLYIGPILYFIYRRKYLDVDPEWHYLLAAFLGGPAILFYGLILYVLEKIKFLIS